MNSWTDFCSCVPLSEGVIAPLISQLPLADVRCLVYAPARHNDTHMLIISKNSHSFLPETAVQAEALPCDPERYAGNARFTADALAEGCVR